MKYTSTFLNALFGLVLLTLSSCSIEGKEVCGIWHAQGAYGKMTIEITPWKGKFLGYLLEYEAGDVLTKGKKSEAFIFLTDLEYQQDSYQNGNIYLTPDSETPCKLTLTDMNGDQIKATYNCAGQTSEEIWYRDAAALPAKTIGNTPPTTNETETIAASDTIAPSQPAKGTTTAPAAPALDQPTQKQSAFYVIGQQKTVAYEDATAMEKAIEALWTAVYDEDFSGKLNNITDANSMYVTYSSYDQPKGKVTITLGYQVKDLSSIPSGLKGVTIPTNDYLVYPLSGKASDFEGEGWEQLGELMVYRKESSADFEVYTFDSSFNVSKAEMWIATE